jgi:hypothetical protein
VKSRAIIFGLATALILTGCSAAAAPADSTPSAHSSSSATPTPTASVEASTEPATIELSTETLQILTADGTELSSFSYFVPVDDNLILALTAAIGAEPTVTVNGADATNPDSLTYEWPGASLTAPNSPADTQYANWSFGVKQAAIGAVSVVTDTGISVGSSRTDAEAAGAVLDDTGSQIFYRVGITDVDRNGEPLAFCLYLIASDDAITEIGGPAHENRG